LTFSRFLFLFSLLVLFCGVTAYLIESLSSAPVLVPKFWVLFGFLTFLTIIAYGAAFLGIQKGGEISVYAIMGSIILKLLLSMILVAVYLLKIKVNSINFATQFFSLYFLFTAFEVYGLLVNLRHQNKK
jgi:hypothetical protein